MQGDADEVIPEIADREGAFSGDPTHQGGGNTDACGGRNEILKGQPHHLREMGHRAFPGIILPIGVTGETCRGVEGQ
jgi:hypothetical protein